MCTDKAPYIQRGQGNNFSLLIELKRKSCPFFYWGDLILILTFWFVSNGNEKKNQKIIQKDFFFFFFGKDPNNSEEWYISSFWNRYFCKWLKVMWKFFFFVTFMLIVWSSSLLFECARLVNGVICSIVLALSAFPDLRLIGSSVGWIVLHFFCYRFECEGNTMREL